MDKCSEKNVRKEEDKGMRGIKAYIKLKTFEVMKNENI